MVVGRLVSLTSLGQPAHAALGERVCIWMREGKGKDDNPYSELHCLPGMCVLCLTFSMCGVWDATSSWCESKMSRYKVPTF